MKKLKWNYDPKFKQWWTSDEYGPCWTINKSKDGKRYTLERTWNITIGEFNKLKNAKECARLISFG